MTERISEIELQAFVDGELDGRGRIHVLDAMLADEAVNRRILGDLRDNELQRLVAGCGSVREIEPERLTPAWALAQPVAQAWPWLGAVGALLLAVIGVQALRSPSAALRSNEPVYLEEARASRVTTLLRHTMTSQPESPALNPRELQRFASLSVPMLPKGWRLQDAQLFPSDFGPSLQLTIQTPEAPILLYVMRGPTGAPRRPTVEQRSGTSTVSWSRGRDTFVLTSNLSRDRLLAAGEDLADNRTS
jgi:anti-sigma factor RsiW